jgi:hypothetical protein
MPQSAPALDCSCGKRGRRDSREKQDVTTEDWKGREKTRTEPICRYCTNPIDTPCSVKKVPNEGKFDTDHSKEIICQAYPSCGAGLGPTRIREIEESNAKA